MSRRPVLDIDGTEVAEYAYTPVGWKHEPLRLLVRVRKAPDEVSGDVRSRRRWTIPKGQVELLARRRVGYVLSLQLPAHRQDRGRGRDRTLAPPART